MVLKVELCNLLDHIVVSMFSEHDHALLPPRNLLRIQLILVILVTRREPVRVVRGVPVATIIPVIIFLAARLLLILLLVVAICCHDLLMIGLQREAGQICFLCGLALHSFGRDLLLSCWLGEI